MDVASCVLLLRASGWHCVAPSKSTPVGEIGLDHDRRRLIGPVAHTQLRRHEYAVLARLARWPGRIVERSDLISAMYAADDEPDSAEEILRATVMSLRTTLEAMKAGARIRTEKAIGYLLEVVR